MTDRLPVTGQTIGEAQRAIAPLLDGVLAEVGTTFETWVTLNTLATKGPAIERARLAQDLAGGLGAEPAAIDELLAGIEAAGLTQPAGAAVELTPAGTALHGRVREGVARNTARLYAGMDPDDLATTRRVLEEVTLRARTLVAQG